MTIQLYENLSRREVIFDYISKNPGIIKSEVLDYMQRNESPHASTRITHDIIHDLIAEGKVISVPDIKNRQKHHLYVNDKNEFGKIYNDILKIETIIEMTGYELEKIQFKQELENFKTVYKVCISSMLQALLIDTSKSLLDENSRQSLYKRIIKLMETFIHQFDILDHPVDFMKLELLMDGYLGFGGIKIPSLPYANLKNKLGLLWEDFKKNRLKTEWQKYRDSICDGNCDTTNKRLQKKNE